MCLSWNVQGLNQLTKRAGLIYLTNESTKSFSNSKYEVVANKTKGVTVVTGRSLNMKINDIGNDTDGRITVIKVTMSNMKIAFISAYATANYDKRFYLTLSNLLMKLSDCYLVIGADMNTIIDPKLDKSNPSEGSYQLSCSKALQQCMSDLSLMDIWCFHNPEVKEYNFFSNRHKSY